eukprot:TRINITY_DN12360_c0_g1_i10.p1 TRINITY_DN12360_c0_g1~~TRINITY_DN12360_c0_g1_i10.p1  ORF type:complete len:111 (+),score=12.78 TRINITY_DN12360_c0_g1_i10:2222-2554(+)
MNSKELFNMKHSTTRNVIKRAFGILKKRWAIFRSPAFYPINIQVRIILACCLLHSYVRNELRVDPYEDIELDEEEAEGNTDHISTIETSVEWMSFREQMVVSMFNSWRST